MEGTEAMTRTMMMMKMQLQLAVRGSLCEVRGGHDAEGRSPSAVLSCFPTGWQKGIRGASGGDLTGSPQHREVDGAEAGLLTQLPVGVVAHPRVVVGLPAEEDGSIRISWRSVVIILRFEPCLVQWSVTNQWLYRYIVTFGNPK